MTQPTSQPVNVTASLEIGLDTVIGSTYRQYNEDGDYSTAPMTLGDAVIVEMARQLLGGLAADEKTELRRTMRERVKALIDERVIPIIEASLAEGFPITNTFGESTGKTTTMRELMLARVGDALKVTTNRDQYQQTPVDKAIKETAEALVAKELKVEMDNARALVKAHVVTSVSKVLAEVVAKELT